MHTSNEQKQAEKTAHNLAVALSVLYAEDIDSSKRTQFVEALKKAKAQKDEKTS